MTKIFSIFFLLSICFFSFIKSEEIVLVSVSPHKFLIEKIAQDTVRVLLLVPAGASAHTYEPTPKQMLMASQASVWFRIGEGFEERALRTLISHRPNMKIVDIREGVNMINSGAHACCCHANCQDLHIWLSPRELKIQAQMIADTLSAIYPQNAAIYKKNLENLHSELNRLDKEIEQILLSLNNRLIVVSHPAYAYFARDYNLRQVSIEFEGKDPTPHKMNSILNFARNEGVTKIFIQPQYPSKGARLFAKELKAEVITLDPYAENVLESMVNIAHKFADQ